MLQVKFQCLLLSSAGHYVKTVTPDVLKSFLDKCCRPVFSTSSAETGSKEGRALKIAVLKGLHSSIAVHDPPESVTAMLYDMVEFVYQHTGSESDVSGSLHTCERFSMIKWEILLQREGDFRTCNKQRRKF
jgi:hypothetical protein